MLVRALSCLALFTGQRATLLHSFGGSVMLNSKSSVICDACFDILDF